jgi:hypothetical protein
MWEKRASAEYIYLIEGVNGVTTKCLRWWHPNVVATEGWCHLTVNLFLVFPCLRCYHDLLSRIVTFYQRGWSK